MCGVGRCRIPQKGRVIRGAVGGPHPCVCALEPLGASLGDLKLQIRIPVPCVTLGLSPDPSEPQSPPLKQESEHFLGC